jgi:glycosyltransferase involved in cell wall biosynthesis
MNILFLTLSKMEDIAERGIYTDLVRELANKEINVYVVSPRERRTNLPTKLDQKGNINVLKVQTGNITKTNFIEKGLSTFTIEGNYLRAIKKYFIDVKFDLIMYSTPPITFEKVVRRLKKENKAKTYLMLKDIFPQNAVDLGLIKKNSLIWRYFVRKEKRLYELSDKIGCMSIGNVSYLLKHNPYIEPSRVEVFPNSINPLPRKEQKAKDQKIMQKYEIPQDATIFVYGGNLGKPQGVDFLLEIVDDFYKVANGYFIIVGNGTEYQRIRRHLEIKLPKNVCLFNLLPKDDYDQLLDIADVGLIFLDQRFTIPNFPSRLTAYMENSLPILAATDRNTDLKEVLSDAKCGLWSESGDIDAFISNAIKLSLDKGLRNKMGCNGRNYLEDNYDIKGNVHIILKHLCGDEADV